MNKVTLAFAAATAGLRLFADKAMKKHLAVT